MTWMNHDTKFVESKRREELIEFFSGLTYNEFCKEYMKHWHPDLVAKESKHAVQFFERAIDRAENVIDGNHNIHYYRGLDKLDADVTLGQGWSD